MELLKALQVAVARQKLENSRYAVNDSTWVPAAVLYLTSRRRFQFSTTTLTLCGLSNLQISFKLQITLPPNQQPISYKKP